MNTSASASGSVIVVVYVMNVVDVYAYVCALGWLNKFIYPTVAVKCVIIFCVMCVRVCGSVCKCDCTDLLFWRNVDV